MAKRKKKTQSALPRFEFLIILVFLMSFIAWAAVKCNNTKNILQKQAFLEDGLTIESDTSKMASALKIENERAQQTAKLDPHPEVIQQTIREEITPLYVNIEELNFRTGPSLNHKIIRKLSMYERVDFMNEITDSIQRIEMPWGMTEEPWIKVKSLQGELGWVYGAGVHYYKINRNVE